MAYRVKVRKQGGSLAVTIPAEVVSKMRVSEGATMYLVEAAPGEFRLTPYDPAFESAMRAHAEAMGQYRDVFRKLAE